MRKFNAFMGGFASVFYGFSGCLFSLFDVIGQSYTSSCKSPASKINVYFDGFQKDRQALKSDWHKIGGDLRQAMDTYAQTHNR